MSGVPPHGADWDAILADNPQLDITGLDIDAITIELGSLPQSVRDDLVARLNAEKAKVTERGEVVGLALDVFKAALGVVV